jgi:hypothetical protein
MAFTILARMVLFLRRTKRESRPPENAQLGNRVLSDVLLAM